MDITFIIHAYYKTRTRFPFLFCLNASKCCVCVCVLCRHTIGPWEFISGVREYVFPCGRLGHRHGHAPHPRTPPHTHNIVSSLTLNEIFRLVFTHYSHRSVHTG